MAWLRGAIAHHPRCVGSGVWHLFGLATDLAEASVQILQNLIIPVSRFRC